MKDRWTQLHLGERLTNVHVLGADWIKTLAFYGSPKLSLTYNGENGVSTIAPSVLMRSSVTWTVGKSRMSLISGQIGQFTLEFLPLIA